MHENGWNIQDDAATASGIIQNTDGTSTPVMLSARWENHPGALRTQVLENTGSKPVPGINLLEQEFRPGYYVRVIMDGKPAAILLTTAGPGSSSADQPGSIRAFAADNPAGEFIAKILRDAAQHDVVPPGLSGVPEPNRMAVGIDDMLTWPDTPGRERLNAAQEFIQENLQDDSDITQTIQALRDSGTPGENDAANLLELQVNEIFGHWGTSLLRETIQEQGMTHKEETEEQIAGCGDTPETIGAGILFPSKPHTLQVFTRVLRQPGWMGFCPVWPTVKGASVIVLESAGQPGRPGCILAGPHRNPRPGGTNSFPRGEAQRLRAILEWHGARSCVWVPSP